jgi:hypothetical protein
LKSADDQYIKILKNELIKYEKQEDGTAWLGHLTCSYIRMYMNAVADSVKLYLQRVSCNIIFKMKQITYYSLRITTPPPPCKEKFWVRPCPILFKVHKCCERRC